MGFLSNLLQRFIVEVIILVLLGFIAKLRANRRDKKTAPVRSDRSKGGSSKK